GTCESFVSSDETKTGTCASHVSSPIKFHRSLPARLPRPLSVGKHNARPDGLARRHRQEQPQIPQFSALRDHSHHRPYRPSARKGFHISATNEAVPPPYRLRPETLPEFPVFYPGAPRFSYFPW